MNIILYLETKMLKKIARNRASPVQAKWQKAVTSGRTDGTDLN